MEERTLSIKEFAELANVSPQALYKSARKTKSKIAPFVVMDGDQIRIKISALKKYQQSKNNEEKASQNEETPIQPLSTPKQPEATPIQPDTTPIQPNENNPKQPIQPPVNPYENQLIEALQAQISHLLEEIEEYKIREKKWEDTAREYEKKIADKEEQIKILTANLADIACKNTEALHSKVYVESLEKAQKIKQEEEATHATADTKAIEDKEPVAEIAVLPQKSFIRKIIDYFK